MLWSDPENRPPRIYRETQGMMHRVGIVLALAMVVAMLVLGVR
ncbi:hypothetical protein AB0O07_23395 [Streptomyces sp. NPDC093085]